MKITFIKTGKRVKPKENIFNTYLKKQNSKKESIKKIDNKAKNETSKIKKDFVNINNKKNGKKTENSKKANNLTISEVFKTVFKKNQIVILTLALMLVTAGYMNYNNKSGEANISIAELGDAKLVSTNLSENILDESEEDENVENDNNIAERENNENIMNNQNSAIETNVELNNNVQTNDIIEDRGNDENNDVKNTSTQIQDTNNYFAQTRLERETMYSQMLETYQKIIENDKIPADQKAIATNEIKNINNRKNAISIIENLIKTKGFKDVVLLINDNNINVVVKQDKNLSEEQVAQITNIVARELNAEIEDIHISVNKNM